MVSDTITAIATGLSSAGISIIRVSGPDAFSIASKLFVTGNRQEYHHVDVATWDSHTVHYGFIFDGQAIVDEVMLVVMKAPKTFTREDVVEIDCHGGIVVTRKILSLVLEAGARLSEPGEFTKRAFLNGRIDLSQAEAVSNIIEAKNELFLKNSVKQLRGNVKTEIQAMRDEVLNEVAEIEAALDDPEHMSLDGFTERLEAATKGHLHSIDRMIATTENGRRMREGIKTVILGKPNAGKSSLLNALLGQERAIVTDIAGTTRDTLSEEIRLNGITLIVTDTAGIRETKDVVEKIGVEMAHKEAQEADLILYVADCSVPLDENDIEIIKAYGDKPMLAILNKSDLEAVTTEKMLQAVCDEYGCQAQVLTLSVREYRGLETLEQKICDMFFAGQLQEDDEVIITSERQKQDLLVAKRSLQEVMNSISIGMPEDFYSVDLTGAYESLGRILGEHMDEDVINRIFSEFCMGK